MPMTHTLVLCSPCETALRVYRYALGHVNNISNDKDGGEDGSGHKPASVC